MRVRVHYNLHKRCLSVCDVKTRRVIRHTGRIILRDVEFRVQESGRLRVIREKRKNVHAFVYGTVTSSSVGFRFGKSRVVSYNPYRGQHFYDIVTAESVHSAPLAIISGKTIFLPHV